MTLYYTAYITNKFHKMQKDINIYFKKLQKNKSQKTFKIIYELSKVQLFGVILRILKKPELSEDCLQEVYVKIWHQSSSYCESKASVMTWMSRIARNHAIDYVRRRELPIQEDFELSVISDEQLDLLDNVNNQQINKQLSKCLQKLKPEVMNILFMSYFNGLTYDNIAQVLEIPPSTIKTWVRRAMPVLKKCMEDSHE